MVRGTTPQLNFTLPIAVSTINSVYITFQQMGETIIEKDLDDCTNPSTYVLRLTLSQEDTLALKQTVPLYCQLRIKVDETVMASQILTLDVGRILKEGEI